MAVLTDYLSRRGEVLVLVFLVALSVLLMFLSSRQQDSVARAISDVALTPVQATIDRSLGFSGLRSENDSLRADLARARLSLNELEQAGTEVDRLRRLLDFQAVSPWDLVPASVIAREAGRRGRDYKINKGAIDGLTANMAVMSVDGLVGKVTSVSERSAWVRPIVSRTCRVSARMDRTRTDGILAWTRELGLHLQFLPFRADVSAGDRIVSSGLGGVFPRGLAIGEVVRAEPVPSEGTLRVLVKPAVDFSALEEVFVIRGATDEPVEGTAAPAAPAGAVADSAAGRPSPKGGG